MRYYHRRIASLVPVGRNDKEAVKCLTDLTDLTDITSCLASPEDMSTPVQLENDVDGLVFDEKEKLPDRHGMEPSPRSFYVVAGSQDIDRWMAITENMEDSLKKKNRKFNVRHIVHRLFKDVLDGKNI